MTPLLIALLFLSSPLVLSKEKANCLAEKIWHNECKGTKMGLTSWNEGEEFASLGIGHFLWYPKGKPKVFQEQFPDFLAFAARKGVTLPNWLEKAEGCPWNSREEFQRALHHPKMCELREFLCATLPLQAEFLSQRLESALPKLTSKLSLKEKERVERNFYQVFQEPNGPYILLDYLNFKGEGISPTERYKGEGWGLLQVLQKMEDSPRSPSERFALTAKAVLANRVKNSPIERNEGRWLKGWFCRIDTYLETECN